MAINIGIQFTASGASQVVGAINSNRKALALYGQQVTKTSKATQTAAASSQGLGAALAAPGAALKAAGASVQNLGRQVESLGRTFTRVGLSMSFIFTVPIVAGIQKSISAFADFEKEMIKISTLVGLTNAEIDGLVNGFEGMEGITSIAQETGVSMDELAQAAFFATSAQLGTAESLELVRFAAMGAQIGLGDVDSITRAAAGAMQAFGIDAEEALDTLVLAVRFGSIELDSFAGVLGRVGGIAAAAGLSFQEATAFISAFTLSGVSASEAVTALRATLTTIIRPTEKGREILAEIGTTAEEVQKQLGEKGLAATLIGLRQEFEEAGVPFQEFFRNIRGLAGVSFVSSDEFADTYANIADAIIVGAEQAGITLTEFQKVAGTTSFQLDLLKANMEVLAITLGAVLAPAFNTVVGRITEIVEAIRLFAVENPKLVAGIGAIAAILAFIGPAIAILGLLVVSIGSVITAIGSLIAALGALLSPVLLIGGAIAALVTAIGVALVSGFLKLQQDSERAFSDFAKDAFAWGKNIIVSLAQGMIAGIAAVVNALQQVAVVITSWLKGASPPRLLPDLPEWGENVMTEFLGGMLNADFVGTFNELSDLIKDTLTSSLEEVTGDDLAGILDIRDALADAFLVIQELGTEAPFAQLVDNLGIANTLLENYVGTMLELAAVSEVVKGIQEEIANINSEFESNVAPLNAELKLIKDQRQEIKDNLRIQELQAIAADETADPLARELALMELREIELKKAIRLQEDLRDEAVSEAEERLTAAQAQEAALQAQAELQRALLDAQTEQLDIFKEIKDLIEEVKDSTDKLAASLESLSALGGLDLDDLGIGTGISGFGEDDFEIPDLSEIIGEGLGEGADSIVDAFNEVVGEISGPINDLIDDFDDMSTAWAELITAFQNADGLFPEFDEDISGVGSAINELTIAVQGFVDGPWEQLTTSLQRAIDTTFPNFSDGIDGVEGSFSGLFDVISVVIGFFGRILNSILRTLIILWEIFLSILVNNFLGTFEIIGLLLELNLNGAMLRLVEIIVDTVVRLFAFLITIVTGMFSVVAAIFDGPLSQEILDNLNALLDSILEFTELNAEEMNQVFADWFEGIVTDFQVWGLDMLTRWQEFWAEVGVKIQEGIDAINLAVATFFLDLITAFQEGSMELTESWNTFWDDLLQTLIDWVADAKLTIENALSAFFTLINEWEPPNFFQKGRDLVQGFINGINSLIAQVRAKIEEMTNASAEAAEAGLEEESPSKVFERIGVNAMAGYIRGLLSMAPDVALATAAAVTPGSVPGGRIAASGFAASTSNTANVNFGGVNINNGMDEAIFEARVKSVLVNVLGEL